MVRVKDIFIPIESNAKRYDAMNKGIFKDLTKHTDVILKKSYEVMHGELGNWGMRIRSRAGRMRE
ncbi:putative sugar kinase YgcE [Shigella sonnei]|nr:putative sugar kinase YgcE [Shigella sonnei]CSH75232.1 carbohydrate kinase FGGY [Shigella sonnei]CSP84233.1 carbohydrate kinase FGGY [Shigella sonnei]